VSSSLTGPAKTSTAWTGTCKGESALASTNWPTTPGDSRISGTLTNAGDLRKSRVAGWRIIFTIDDANRVVYLVTIERRGQVYKRL